MKHRWKILVSVVAVGLVCSSFFLRADNPWPKMAEETRRALILDGFKVDVSQFDFSAPLNVQDRMAFLSAFQRSGARIIRNDLRLLHPAAAGSAIVVWKSDPADWDVGSPYRRQSGSTDSFWPALEDALSEHKTQLDTASQAVLSGQIRFGLNAIAGTGMMLPHLAPLKELQQVFAGRMLVELRHANSDAAWTNLLALTRLVTAWNPEPVEISYLVRYGGVSVAYGATWQALQFEKWPDERLANLQREWESVDFLTGVPDTVAFTRASQVQAVRSERSQPLAFGVPLKEIIRSPRYAFAAYQNSRNRDHYRTHGSYEDENDLMLYFRDRELELRRALKSTNWLEMRSLPGVINVTPFKSKHSSTAITRLNMRSFALNLQGARREGLISIAARAEAQRRLIITAIALERHRIRYGSYPSNLNELAPYFLKSPLVDFMDGRPLRYRLADDKHFVLYSVGLDCVDNDGKMRDTTPEARLAGFRGGEPPESDLVWPRPASSADMAALAKMSRVMKEQRREREDARIDQREESFEVRQSQAVKRLLQVKRAPLTKDVKFHGQPLRLLLQNTNAATKATTMDDLLTLKQIPTGAEPEIITFEVPINYDALTNIGTLWLNVDPQVSEEMEEDEQRVCERAANGNCLLVWNTTYDPQGIHLLQAALGFEDNDSEDVIIGGPYHQVTSTNLFRFSHSYDYFEPSEGATLYARLPEQKGDFRIKIISPSGELAKTVSGSTSNGIIRYRWNLIDDRGNRYTNEEFRTVYEVTLPESGRSQTLKGP